MIRAALQSPHFLYRLETTAPASASAQLVPLSQYELASRLSFLIWGVGPGRRAARRRRARRAGRPGRTVAAQGARDARRSEGARGDHRLLQPVDRHQPPRHHDQEHDARSRPTTDAVRDAMKARDARVRRVRALDRRPQARDAADLAGRVRVQRAGADLRRDGAGGNATTPQMVDAARRAGAGGHPDAGRASCRCRPTPIRRRRCCAASSCAPS